MKRWWRGPKTLLGQLVLALMIGLIVANLAGMWLVMQDRLRYTRFIRGEYAAQRIADIVSVLNETPAGERDRLVRVLDAPPTHLTMAEPWKTPAGTPGDDAEAFADVLRDKLSTPFQVLSLKSAPYDHHRRPRMTERDGPPKPMPLVFVQTQARLGDGTVATFSFAIPQSSRQDPYRLLGWLLLVGAAVSVLSFWAVRRLTRPLAMFSAAATGLAKNLDQPPLQETGPQEVADAARAFNAMQRELKRYLETRAQTLAGVSHDLRLPITRVRLRLEKLADAKLKGDIEHDLLEMDEMIDNTLAFLRADASSEKAVKINVAALLDGVIEDMEALGAEPVLNGDTRRPLTGRPLALRRCLSNLLDNARRYGGPQIDVDVSEQGDTLEIRISDHGPGIPEADRERVFEPYVRLEASRARHTGGSGLGLAIARATARSHGGEIRLTDRHGGGLVVVLTLPLT
ncbi:ATP-binding protein [Jeongeupia naejangsanensis]|uniref:histidine kinase n=1 Tax=Jeongeupia naejangsanensis TaxID=613195 RepID=A0ABS2BMJ3_9NEIS|nr:ATP-binding protein [Jeongeupia naejangsanensis]MBM3116226.1 HAMP domain-containing protein [Jeongeupia naejangsanensis]